MTLEYSLLPFPRHNDKFITKGVFHCRSVWSIPYGPNLDHPRALMKTGSSKEWSTKCFESALIKLIERILKSTFCHEGFENNETVWIFIFLKFWSFDRFLTLEYKVIIYNPKLITWSIGHMILKSRTDLVIMNKTEYTRSKDKRRSENEVIFKQMLVNTVDSSFLRIEVISDDFIIHLRSMFWLVRQWNDGIYIIVFIIIK